MGTKCQILTTSAFTVSASRSVLVELIGLAQRKPQRDEHHTLLRWRLAPGTDMTLHAVIGALVPLRAQQLEQPSHFCR